MNAFFKKAGAKEPNGAAPVNATMFDAAAAKPRYVPWIEKYRPTSVEDISHQVEVVQALRSSV